MMSAENVTAVITTRGDVDLEPVLDSLDPVFGDRIVVWNNMDRSWDAKVFGYFAALHEVDTEYVFTQADDALVDARALLAAWTPDDEDRILLNVADGDTPWISFGGLFRTLLPEDAFRSYVCAYHLDDPRHDDILLWCEVIFCELTPWRNVDLGKTDLEWSSGPGRMWGKPDHYTEQDRVRQKARALLS